MIRNDDKRANEEAIVSPDDVLTLGGILYVHTVGRASQWASQMTLFTPAELRRKEPRNTHTHTHSVSDGWPRVGPMDIEPHASSAGGGMKKRTV